MGDNNGYVRDSTELVMANLKTITEMLSRDDISAYARSALQRLVTDLTFELARRARGSN